VIFAPIGGFLGMGHRTPTIAFSLTDRRCYANEIWDKIGYNSACVKDICEIFAPIGGFSGMGHRMLPITFLYKVIQKTKVFSST